MYEIPPEARTILEKLNASVRIVHRGATMKKENGEMVVDKPGAITAVITDKTLNKEYCQAEGESEQDAIVQACRKAMITEKPMTAAQLATRGQVQAANASEAAARTELNKVNDELAKIKAELAEATALLNQKPTEVPPPPPPPLEITSEINQPTPPPGPRKSRQG